MGEFATKSEDEEGEVRWLASDGKSYKTRAGAWKHSKNLEAKAEPEPVDEVEPSPVDDSEPDPLSWASVDFSGDVEDAPSEDQKGNRSRDENQRRGPQNRLQKRRPHDDSIQASHDGG